MQTLRVHSLLARKIVYTAAHLSWLFRAVAPLGCAMVFAIGCAHVACLPSSLAGLGPKPSNSGAAFTLHHAGQELQSQGNHHRTLDGCWRTARSCNTSCARP